MIAQCLYAYVVCLMRMHQQLRTVLDIFLLADNTVFWRFDTRLLLAGTIVICIELIKWWSRQKKMENWNALIFDEPVLEMIKSRSNLWSLIVEVGDEFNFAV